MEKSIGTAALLGALCLALMPTTPAYAANWVYVTIDGSDDAIIYYDSDTTQRSGDQVTVWEKWDYSGSKNSKKREMLAHTRYNCADRTYKSLYAIVKYKDGTAEAENISKKTQTDPVVPDTVVEAQFTAVCR